MFEIRYKSHHNVEEVISKFIKSESTTSEKITKEDFLNILNSKNETKQLGLYFHTPYCDKICSFCNMNRKELDNDLEEYTEYICNEIEKYSKFEFVKTSEIDVVFFGGGTPTIYKANQLERILKALRENYKFSENYEMTFETTIHNLSFDKVEILGKYGVNRISIGVQTFSDRGRKYLNRSYDKKYIIKRIEQIKSKFSGLVCIDIIYNYPKQTNEEILEDAEILSKLQVDSVSFYSLMIHNGSEISKNPEDAFIYDIKRDEELHNLFYNKCLENGYKLLELTKLSNGKDKYKYIRNNNSLKNLLPIGVGAGGKVSGIGCYNLNKEMSFYSKSSELQKKLSTISGMLQFDRFNLENLKKYCPENTYEKVYKKIQTYKEEGYIDIVNSNVSYTEKGIFWGNSISVCLIEEIIKNL